jgi:hypothetical protein
MAKKGNRTGYIINEGIDQVFTSGPAGILGTIVTSSYSNGSNTFGPSIDYNIQFISGTIDTITPCNVQYYRYYEDPILCSNSGCPQPILTSVTANCNPYNYAYSISYNFISSSEYVPSSSVEYSTSSDFSFNTGSQLYDNTQQIQLPVDISDLDLLPLPTTLVYFKVKNLCIDNISSSYSNVLSASCSSTPPAQRSTVTITDNNQTFPGSETIFRVNGSPGSVINYSTSQINSGLNGAYIEMFDQFGVQYSIDSYDTRSGTITIPSSGQMSLTINYVANGTNSPNSNNVSMVLTFLDSSNTGEPLSPDGSMYLSDSYEGGSAQ